EWASTLQTALPPGARPCGSGVCAYHSAHRDRPHVRSKHIRTSISRGACSHCLKRSVRVLNDHFLQSLYNGKPDNLCLPVLLRNQFLYGFHTFQARSASHAKACRSVEQIRCDPPGSASGANCHLALRAHPLLGTRLAGTEGGCSQSISHLLFRHSRYCPAAARAPGGTGIHRRRCVAGTAVVETGWQFCKRKTAVVDQPADRCRVEHLLFHERFLVGFAID